MKSSSHSNASCFIPNGVIYVSLDTLTNQRKSEHQGLQQPPRQGHCRLRRWIFCYDLFSMVTNSIVNCNKQIVACCLAFSVVPIEVMKTLLLKEKLLCFTLGFVCFLYNDFSSFFTLVFRFLLSKLKNKKEILWKKYFCGVSYA